MRKTKSKNLPIPNSNIVVSFCLFTFCFLFSFPSYFSSFFRLYFLWVHKIKMHALLLDESNYLCSVLWGNVWGRGQLCTWGVFDLYALQVAFGLLLQLLHTLMTIFTTRQQQHQQQAELYNLQGSRVEQEWRGRQRKKSIECLFYSVHRYEKATCVALCVRLSGLWSKVNTHMHTHTHFRTGLVWYLLKIFWKTCVVIATKTCPWRG